MFSEVAVLFNHQINESKQLTERKMGILQMKNTKNETVIIGEMVVKAVMMIALITTEVWWSR